MARRSGRSKRASPGLFGLLPSLPRKRRRRPLGGPSRRRQDGVRTQDRCAAIVVTARRKATGHASGAATPVHGGGGGADRVPTRTGAGRGTEMSVLRPALCRPSVVLWSDQAFTVAATAAPVARRRLANSRCASSTFSFRS